MPYANWAFDFTVNNQQYKINTSINHLIFI